LLFNEILKLFTVSVKNQMAAASLISCTDLSLTDLKDWLIQLTSPS